MTERVLYGNRLLQHVPVDPKGAVFGLVGTDPMGKPAAWPISADTLRKHMLLLGAIGTGKTNAMNCILSCVRSTMTRQDVMFVFDTKGDYYKEFYRPGDVVISNDRRATNGHGADYWNLFGEVAIDGHEDENAAEIAKAIFADRLERTSQPFFPNAGKDLLTALVLDICRRKDRPERMNNEALLRMLQTLTSARMVRLLSGHTDLTGMIPYIQDPKSGQTLGVISELQSATRELFIGNFARKGGISIRNLVRQKGGRVVFVEYDLGIGGVLTPIYRLLFDLAIKEALCRNEREPGKVYFVLDEFSLLPRLNHIDDGVNFGRSLGVTFLAGAQNVSQVYDAYGEDRANSLLSGFSTTVCFRLNDGKSRAFVKELNGKNGRITSYDSDVRAKGMIDQYREAYVVEDHDLLNLRTGEAVIRSGNYPPFRFRFKEYGK